LARRGLNPREADQSRTGLGSDHDLTLAEASGAEIRLRGTVRRHRGGQVFGSGCACALVPKFCSIKRIGSVGAAQRRYRAGLPLRGVGRGLSCLSCNMSAGWLEKARVLVLQLSRSNQVRVACFAGSTGGASVPPRCASPSCGAATNLKPGLVGLPPRRSVYQVPWGGYPSIKPLEG